VNANSRWRTTVAKSRSPKVRLRPRVPTDVASSPAGPAPTQKPTKPGFLAGARPRPSDPEFWTVVNEITDPVPIAPAELDAIESYFSAVLDAVFDHSRKSSR
jgi:hypothetical protein